MKVPLSWLKDYVEIELPLPQLARLLTMAGLEVEEIRLVGLPAPSQEQHEFNFNGLSWDPEKIIVARIDEVMPHPNADRLVLCRLNDGAQEFVVLTGAPNLYPYKEQGALEKPLKVAYAREGARIYDGHQPGQVLTTLKHTKIRGIESFSMVCSEKELGISEEHEGIIVLDENAPTGTALADYMGDAVFEISILPNMIRNACMIGVAREIAALTGKPLRKPERTIQPAAPSIAGQVSIEILEPALNPRFVLGLIRGAASQPSPYWVQRRLRLAGMRPINSIVDATNYVMLELGEPLHAFDYDVLVERTGGNTPTIITRTARPGEKLTTLDNVERKLDDFTVLVCDTAGALSIAGVMGGLESEITEKSRNILLEGASWNFINVRRTVASQRLNSEAAYRFSRNIHPELAKEGVLLGLERIACWSGGKIAEGLIDAYPQPADDPVITITEADVKRHLGIELWAAEIAALLEKLEFTCRVDGDTVHAKTPPHRTDIGEGMTGQADLIEEIARLYGYDSIPDTRLSVELPPQRGNPVQEMEERLRDILAGSGLQEIVTYRLTSPEREARLLAAPDTPYIRLQNPIAADRNVMRRSLLASALEVLERNIRLRERLAFFEIGPVFLPRPDQALPAEPHRLSVVMTGKTKAAAWDRPAGASMDFFDLKGVIEALLETLHIENIRFEPITHPYYHPGKCAQVLAGGITLGVIGELHPLVKARYDLGALPVVTGELEVGALLTLTPDRHNTHTVAIFPPVLEDIAVIVAEEIPAEQIVATLFAGGGKLLSAVHLFDIYRGAQVGDGKKSMAYSLTYQASDHTLNDKEAAQIRQRIIHRLEQDLGASIRSQ
ncbi:MAG: phenylalanine--tRNA ligase subunit beta [Anaerolineaceae bacterium]|nr:phenylalanine--tRNA ligase subunit beta [Anaerolineaceae bacterium]